MRRRPARVDDALGNALVVEVRDLFTQNEVFEEGRTAQPGLQRVLVVGNGDALIGGQRPFARIHSHAIQGAVRLVLADDGSAAAHFVGPVLFLDGARPHNRVGRFDGHARLRPDRGLWVVLERLVGVEGQGRGQLLRGRHLRREVIRRVDERLRVRRPRDGGAAVRIDGERCVGTWLFRLGHNSAFAMGALYTSTSPLGRAQHLSDRRCRTRQGGRAQGRGRDGQTWNNRRHSC